VSSNTHIFYPVANEKDGTWDDTATELTYKTGRNITTMTEDTKKTFLLQRLSMALQRKMQSCSRPPWSLNAMLLQASGGASAVKEPGHFESENPPARSPGCTFFLKRKLTTFF